MSLYREADFQRWYDNTRRQQMSENTARQIFFSGADTPAELARLQSGNALTFPELLRCLGEGE